MAEGLRGRNLQPAAHAPRGADRDLIERRRFVRTPMALGIATASHFGRPQSLHIRRSGPGGMIWKRSSRSATANQSSENCWAQARAATPDHRFDHHCTLFGLIRHRSPLFRMPLDLRRWTSVHDRGPAADGWGSRGRGFRFCRPDRQDRSVVRRSVHRARHCRLPSPAATS